MRRWREVLPCRVSSWPARLMPAMWEAWRCVRARARKKFACTRLVMPPFSRAVSRTHDVLYRLCPQRGMLNFGLWDLRLVDPNPSLRVPSVLHLEGGD